MTNLISGKEALIALANGESVQKRSDSWAGDHWLDISKKEPFNLDLFLSGLNRHGETIEFRIKPRTITINGIEVPAPFEPKEGVDGHIIDLVVSPVIWDKSDPETYRVGSWRTKEEIRQVVAALRQIFGGV